MKHILRQPYYPETGYALQPNERFLQYVETDPDFYDWIIIEVDDDES